MTSARLSPTMQTIAAQAGVNRSTVSRALRDDPHLPVETRRRIQALARELGYRPNPLVVSLMMHLRGTRPAQRTVIAHLTAIEKAGAWKNYYPYREYVEGAAQRARELGFDLQEFWMREPGMTSRRMSEILLARGIRGVLVGGLIPVVGHLSLDWAQFASAALGYSVRLPQLHRVVPDYVHNVSLALRELKRRGYRRIGLAVWSPIDVRTAHRWTAGFLAHQQHIRATDRVPLFEPKTWTESQFARWYRTHRPEVVVSTQRETLAWLVALARVPEETGYADLTRPPQARWAGVDHNARIIGAAAIDLIASQLQRNEYGVPKVPKVVHIRGEWVDGPTVRQRPG